MHPLIVGTMAYVVARQTLSRYWYIYTVRQAGQINDEKWLFGPPGGPNKNHLARLAG